MPSFFRCSRLVLAIGLAVSASQAHAALVTSAPATATVIDFSQFAETCDTIPEVLSPACLAGSGIDVGGLVGETVLYSGDDLGAGGARLFNIQVGSGLNGFWDSGRNGFASVNTTSGQMTFTFLGGTVSLAGGFINYLREREVFEPLFPPILEALGAGGVVLESYNILSLAPITLPFVPNGGAFRGIYREENDIVALRYRGSFAQIDDLTFVRAVPEPSTFGLLWAGLGLLLIGRVAGTRTRRGG